MTTCPHNGNRPLALVSCRACRPQAGWQVRKLSLGWLKKQAFDHRDRRGIFDWLQAIGVVPEDVRSMQSAPVRTNLQADTIPAGYLASVAWEWDTWGPSNPIEFCRAIEMETNGNSGNDFVASLLRVLGRDEMALVAA